MGKYWYRISKSPDDMAHREWEMDMQLLVSKVLTGFLQDQIETILHVMKDCLLLCLYGLSPSVELEKQRETWC